MAFGPVMNILGATGSAYEGTTRQRNAYLDMAQQGISKLGTYKSDKFREDEAGRLSAAYEEMRDKKLSHPSELTDGANKLAMLRYTADAYYKMKEATSAAGDNTTGLGILNGNDPTPAGVKPVAVIPDLDAPQTPPAAPYVGGKRGKDDKDKDKDEDEDTRDSRIITSGGGRA